MCSNIQGILTKEEEDDNDEDGDLRDNSQIQIKYAKMLEELENSCERAHEEQDLAEEGFVEEEGYKKYIVQLQPEITTFDKAELEVPI